MIRYSLQCEHEHEFDSWFPDSSAYDEQARRGLVECPLCRSTQVRKSIMSPRLAKGGAEVPRDVGTPDSDGAVVSAQKPAILDERLLALRTMIRDMRTSIAKHTTDVGSAFPEEARRMHEGDIEHRPIRGEATPDEARALIEDCVPILPVPMLPDDRN